MPDWLQPLQPKPRRVATPPVRVTDGSVSFERAVEHFIEFHVSRKTGRPFSPTSKRNVRDNLLGGPLTVFRKDRAVDTIEQWSGDLAAEYLHWLQHELRRDSATIKKVRGQLRSFGAFCGEHYGAPEAGGGALDTLRVSAATDFDQPSDPALSRAEADQLLKAASSSRDRLIVAMLLYTGMRPSELVAVDVSYVLLDRTPPVVQVRGSRHDLDIAPSGAGFRDVPLTVGQTVLPRLLRAHLADPSRPATASRLFLSLRRDRRGRAMPLTTEGLKAMLATLGASTGIHCNAYRFRHTFCTWCAGAGVHMLHLQQLLGLRSSDMIARYYRGRTNQGVLEAAARVRF